MDGWMDGWMDGLMDGWMDGWIDICLGVLCSNYHFKSLYLFV